MQGRVLGRWLQAKDILRKQRFLVTLTRNNALALIAHCSLFIALLCFPAHSQEIFEKPVRLEADYIAYAFDKNMIVATGHISATLGSLKINADSLQIDLNQRYLAAQGHVVIGQGAVSVETLPQEKPTAAQIAKEVVVVAFPLEKDTVDQTPLDVVGYAQEGLNVRVNDVDVTPAADGKFQVKIPLQQGENIITFTAQDAATLQDVRTFLRTVFYDPGSQKSLQGDSLKFNLSTLQGTLYKVEKDVEVVNFIGEDLHVISTPVEPQTVSIKIPDLNRSTLAMVAKRVQFILGKKLEAWSVSLWVKGVRTFSIPYYTTDVEIDFPDLPFSIYSVNYRTKEGASFNSALALMKGRRAQGTYYLDYVQKSQMPFGGHEQKWTSRLAQHIALGRRKDLNFAVNNVGEKKWSGNASYSQYFGSDLEASVSYNYANPVFWGANFHLSRRFDKSALSLQHTMSKPLNKPNIVQSYNVSWQGYPEMLPNTRASFSWAVQYGMTVLRAPKKSSGTLTTSFNLSRSAIVLTKTLIMNTSLNTGQTLQNDRYAHSISSSLSLNQRIKPYTSIGAGLSSNLTFLSSDTSSETVTSNIISFNMSTGRKRWWQLSAGNSYNWQTKKFGIWSGNVNVLLNKVIQTRLSASYDHKKNKFPATIIYADYKLFGPGDSRRIQMNFDTKKGEYWLGLSSNI